METQYNPQEFAFDEDLYTINWDEIERETGYDFYLNDIENFFKEDFENDVIEDEISE